MGECILTNRGGISGSGALNIATGTLLPGAAVNGQLYIVTTVPAVNILLSDTVPTTPATGDIFVKTDSSGTQTFPTSTGKLGIQGKIAYVSQWSGTAWVYRAAYLGVSNAWQAVSATFKSFADCTWDEVAHICNCKLASTFWQVGDCNSMVIRNRTISIIIEDFNHDPISDENGYAAATFSTAEVIERKSYSTTSVVSTYVSYQNSIFYDYLPNTILPSIAQDIRNNIKMVNKQYYDSAGNTMTYSACKIWPFSATELGAAYHASSSPYVEGNIYPRYVNNAERIRKYNGVIEAYYTKSFVSASEGRQCVINGTGGFAGIAGSSQQGVVIGFCM